MLCLEGQAVQAWYYLKRQLIADSADVDSWQIFSDAMTRHFEGLSPDIVWSLRDSLSALQQGGTTVQLYDELAVQPPLTGAAKAAQHMGRCGGGRVSMANTTHLHAVPPSRKRRLGRKMRALLKLALGLLGQSLLHYVLGANALSMIVL